MEARLSRWGVGPRIALAAALTVVIAVAIATNLAAKEPDKEEPLRKRVFIPNSVGATLMLLDTELVQKEIGLTHGQKVKIEPMKKALGDAYEEIFRDNPAMPESQKEDKLNSTKVVKDGSVMITIAPHKPSQRTIRIEQATKEADQRVQKQLDEVLQPCQLDRIWEIILQSECFFQAGSEWLGGLPELDEVLLKTLAISEDQVIEIEAIRRDAQIAMRFILQGVWDELEKASQQQRHEILHQRIETLRPIIDRANKKVQAALTPKQRDTIVQMKGKEIDFIDLLAQFLQQRPAPIQPPPP